MAAAVQRSAVVYSEIPLHPLISEARRSELARELFLELNRLCKPVGMQRPPAGKVLPSVMLALATYQVLVIPAPPEDDRFGLRAQPGISR